VVSSVFTVHEKTIHNKHNSFVIYNNESYSHYNDIGFPIWISESTFSWHSVLLTSACFAEKHNAHFNALIISQ